ncbi:MAG: hypothetical protein IJH64_02885 [Oscillospiraceae bacterium]|nr:hypothetical protein [Oscillospiraceae bacterium]
MLNTNIRPFINAVKTEMQSRLYDYILTEQEVVKMNDITLHGLIARREGEDAGATVYLDEPFRRYMNGANLIDIADELSEVVLGAESVKPMVTSDSIDLSFDAIKDKLTLRLVDIEKNEKYLDEHPHRFIGAGLAVVAEINIGDDFGIVVNNSLAEDYDIIALFDTAEENMKALYPAQLMNIGDALLGEGRNILDSTDEDIEGLYTLMIDSHGFGASTLAYKGVTERIYDLFGAYYILPSSLHEVIILKDDGTARASDLKDMVVQANRSVVEPTDVLSDSVFHYGADGLSRIA